MCSMSDDTVNYIVSESPKLAQKIFKKKLDWIGRHIY